jgi:hypothetical protein
MPRHTADSPPGIERPANAADALDWLRRLVPVAIADSQLALPTGGRDPTIQFAGALSLRLVERMDARDAGRGRWSVCAKQCNWSRIQSGGGPLAGQVKFFSYEERNDLSFYTEPSEGDARSWPVLNVESEAAHWYHVDENWFWNDYLWDYYKLFAARFPANLFVARVSSYSGVPTHQRMSDLLATLERAAFEKYQHLIPPGHPNWVVMLPGDGSTRVRLAAAVTSEGDQPAGFVDCWL